MNDNKLPIVTPKVWCENVRKANKAHASFIIEEGFFLPPLSFGIFSVE